MGLRCLVGHNYGDLQTESERDETDDEVVITIREYRECSRCGNRRIVSENKEVKPLSPSPEEENEPPEPTSPSPEYEASEEISAEDDDGIILPDDAPAAEEAADERARGEWPDSEHEHEPETPEEESPKQWPDPKGNDEGFNAEPDNGEPASDVEFSQNGLMPERRQDSDEDHEPGISATAGAAETDGSSLESGIRRSGPGPSPTGRQQEAGPDAVFVCPECGYESPGVGASLRAGDICPECRNGYMSEQAD